MRLWSFGCRSVRTTAVTITSAALGVVSSAWAHRAIAEIDRHNANYSWGTELTLSKKANASVGIMYNSRSLYDGLFGLGWCSDIETKTEVNLDGGFTMTECGSGRKMKFELVQPDRMTSADLAEVVARRGKGKAHEHVITRKKTPLDTAENVRTLLAQGVTEFELRELLGVRAPELGAGRYVASDGSIADFDGARIRVKERDSKQWVFDPQGHLVELRRISGEKLAIVARSPSELTFDVQGVRGSARIGPAGRIEHVRADGHPATTFQYAEIHGRRMLASIVDDTERWGFEYDQGYNLTAVRRNGKLTERISYDQARDWVTSFEDISRGCVDTYAYLNEADADVDSTLLANRKKLETFARIKDEESVYFTKVRRKCRGSPESLKLVQGWAHSRDDEGKKFMAATTVWAAGYGVSFAEYAPNGDLRAVTQPPVAVRSAIDRSAGRLTNSLLAVRYREPEDCMTDLFAEGVVFPAGTEGAVLFSARAHRSSGSGMCLITSVEWTMNAGQFRLAIERDDAGASHAVVLDGLRRFRRVATGEVRSPSNCSLYGLQGASDEKRIGTILAKALSSQCSAEQQIVYQIALVMSSIQSPLTCQCAYVLPSDHTVADFGRWILMDEFVMEPAVSAVQR
ncbi:hypothetical protein [Accumulibacter sp.]|uniref:hypothetical protein n=1 Tax=Accumulibacter sp. TaxID=2053492 RepID=UPI002602F877|nr:hypothetical protein [Accumulibacter sp.]